MDGNKLEVNGNLYGVGVAQDGSVVNQNIIVPEYTTPKQLTSKLGKDTIIGRVKELEEIDALLKESSSLLLINGIGGIGKSTIASYYLHSQKDNLDYYGFFEGLESFSSELRKPLSLQQEEVNDVFLEALSKLRNLKGNKLLVFEDVKDIEENQDKIEKILALKNSGYKILLTSREEIEDIEQYYLDVLSLADAKELFNSIYKVEEDVLLEEILGYLDCHTFFVEMTAKTLESKKTLTPEIIKDKFKKGEFSTIKRDWEKSFNDYLNQLFSFDKLDDEEILMLKQFSVLPSIEIEFGLLQEIFNNKDDEKFEDIFNYLCKKGWLSSFENGYKLHQIIKNYVQSFHIPSFEDIETIVSYFSSHINKGDFWIEYLESVASVSEKLNFKNKKVLDLYFFTGKIYHEKYSSYESAKKYLLLNEKIWKELQIDYNIENTYALLARVFEFSEKLDDALTYINQALEIFIDKKEDKSIAICYDDIGSIYWKEARVESVPQFLDESLYYFNKGLKFYKKLNYLCDSAIVLNNISLIYKEKNDYKKSHKYLKEALSLDIEDKKTLAQFYNNRGELYLEEEKYELAEKDILLALKIREELYDNYELDKNHDCFAETFDNLAIIYFKREKYQEAKVEQEKAIEIWSFNHNNDSYSYLIEARERLLLIEKEL